MLDDLTRKLIIAFIVMATVLAGAGLAGIAWLLWRWVA